ncbi:MAG: hypothetical protein DRJ50_02110 [Actinobacteria bacterium]|nr:MAG: hypothetical protein DRJ50_02110 [Actinomycetota bacterium]
MSILQWIQGLGWRLGVLIVVPLVAGVIAYFVVADEPSDYRAISTVVAPIEVSASPTPQVANQAVAEFQALVSSTAFTEAVAPDAGVSPQALRAGLVTSRLGAGTIVEISFTSADPAKSVSAVTVVGHRSAELILSDDLAMAEEAVHLTLSDLEAADAATSTMIEANGGNPALLLEFAADQLVQAQSAWARAVAAGGDSLGLKTLEAEIDHLQANVDGLLPIAAEYEPLEQARSAAESAYNDSVEYLRSVEALMAATEQSVVDPAGATELSNRIPVAQKVVTVMLLALVLALVLVVVIDLIRPRPGRVKF